MTEQDFSRGSSSKALILAATVLLLGSCLFAAEQSGPSEAIGHKILSLTHISAKQGKKYLAEAKVGTVSQLPGANALLVTAPSRELTKATAVLQVVDAKEQFVIKAILPRSAAKTLPSKERIAAAVGDLSIGDFVNPPANTTAARAIIDIHNDKVVVVAPVGQFERIIVAIEQLQKPGGQEALQAPEPNEPKAPKGVEERKAPPPTETGEITLEVIPEPKTEPEIELKTEPKIELKTEPKIELKTEPKIEPQMKPGEVNEPGEIAEPIAVIRPYEPEPIPNGDDTLKLDLPEKVDIVLLLGLVGEYLGLDFMYDPAKIKGDVTLKLKGKYQGPIKVKDLYPLLESVLKFRGFVMARRGNLVTVVAKEEANDIDPALLKADEREVETGDVVVTRVFDLKHIDTASATNLLTAMKLGENITPIAETKTLIITGYAYRMPRVETILQMIDKPGEKKKFRSRPLKYTMAKTLAEKVKTLAEQLGTVSISISAPSAAPPTPVTRRPGESDAAYRARVTAAARSRSAIRLPSAPTATAEEPSVYLDADERTNRILMIGLEDQLATVEELIDTLDVEQQDLRSLKLYKIEHVDAEEVKKKLGELGIIGASPTTSSRITPASRTEGAAPTARPPTARPPTTSRTGETTEALVEEPQVVVIETTNSLLVNATPEQHAQITTILGYVDSETLEDEIPYKIYPLENSSPEHLTELLEKLIQETVTDPEGKIEKVIKKKEDQIIIVSDPNTYSLIVYASKNNQEWISNLIKTLDKRRPQVLIDVTLVEVSKSDKFEYDLDLIESFPDLTSTSGLTSAIMGDANSTNLVSRLIGSGRDRFLDFQAGGGVGTGFYADKHINALLTAMQTKDYGRVLAKPKILVNDNQTGTISTTDTTYVAKRSSVPVSGGTAGTTTTLIETAVDYTGYDAGITLDITPHISKGELLQLVITLTRSDFGTITGEKPPDTTASDITTTVTVPDGSTIILGGMLKLNQSKGGSKVPILGDIPLIGALFRSVSNSDLQRNLYVFVKAEVLRPDETHAGVEDLEKISERNRLAFEQFEDKFQNYQNFPGIKPKPVEPVKVLDAQ